MKNNILELGLQQSNGTLDMFSGALLVWVVVCILGMLFCLYLLYRNEKVCDYRIGIIWSENGLSDYNKLPSYDYMLYHFWVWPLSKFMPKDKE